MESNMGTTKPKNMITIENIIFEHVNIQITNKFRNKIVDKLGNRIFYISDNKIWNKVRDQLYFKVKQNIKI